MLAERLLARAAGARRAFTTSVTRRAEPQYQAPNPAPPKVNPHRQFYRTQGFPVFKAALIAITTYELLYWGWLKLESLETVAEQEGTMKQLQQEVRDIVKAKTG